jgi:uncharacterized protein YdhG (YjbR/CyaY superfamily)
MPAEKKQINTIDEYIETFPKDVQRILEKVRQAIRKTAPKATETISYQIPTFKLDGKYLVYFAAWKTHIGMYPVPAGTEAFKKEVAPYKGAKSTLRFRFDKPIPYDLVKKMVTFLIKENQERKNKRKT